MTDAETPITNWGVRALAHASLLARAHRGSATPGEAQAARYVQGELAKLGIEDVQIQSFPGLRSLWLFLSLVFGLALVGHAAYWMLRNPLGTWPTLAIVFIAFSMSGYLLWRKFTFRDYPFRETLPHGPSQNVIAVLPPLGEVNYKIVVVSHLDSHRAVFWYASDFLMRVFSITKPLAMFGVIAAPLLYTLAVLTGWAFFGWIALFLALIHFLSWFTGVTADLGPYSPGANDNAASVGVVLGLAERLRQQPLQNTEVWLAFTGCEETGCDGMLTLLDKHAAKLRDALFINFEMPGIGDQLVYIKDEGVIRAQHISASVENLVQMVGKGYDISPMKTAGVGAFTEGGVLWEHGFQGVTLMTFRKGSPLPPEWHRLTDTPDRLEAAALDKMGKLGWDLLKWNERS